MSEPHVCERCGEECERGSVGRCRECIALGALCRCGASAVASDVRCEEHIDRCMACGEAADPSTAGTYRLGDKRVKEATGRYCLPCSRVGDGAFKLWAAAFSQLGRGRERSDKGRAFLIRIGWTTGLR